MNVSRPAIRSCSAGALPLYGTCVSLVFKASASEDAAVCAELP